MDNIWKVIGKQCEAFGASWAVYSAAGSFLLYLLGYLVTRYQLTMLGVGTNLDVLEERYFFAGAKFAVYLLASIPTVVLLLFVLAGIAWLISRILPARLRASCVSRVRSARPGTLYVAGIIVGVIGIQFVARQCFVFKNLLLAKTLPGPAWLQAVLLDDEETFAPLFFAGLVAATALTAAFLFAGSSRPTEQGEARGFQGLLALLLGLQALLLPINYAILIGYNTFPRVAETSAAAPGQAAWLIWENNDAATFLVAQATAPQVDRGLITINQKESKDKDRIVAYEPLLRILFPNSK